jgi:hypothetical protein
MALDVGVDAVLYQITAGTCTCSSGEIAMSGGTCAAIGYIDNYSINENPASLDTTAFGDFNTKSVNGIMTVSASISGTYDASNTQQDALRTAAGAGTILNFRLKKAINKEAKTFRARVGSVVDSGTPSGKINFSAELRCQSKVKTCTYA